MLMIELSTPLLEKVTIPDREPMKLCGENSPDLIVTDSNTVRLDYHTDDEGLSKGWSLDYSTHSEGERNGGRTKPVSMYAAVVTCLLVFVVSRSKVSISW